MYSWRLNPAFHTTLFWPDGNPVSRQTSLYRKKEKGHRGHRDRKGHKVLLVRRGPRAILEIQGRRDQKVILGILDRRVKLVHRGQKEIPAHRAHRARPAHKAHRERRVTRVTPELQEPPALLENLAIHLSVELTTGQRRIKQKSSAN